MKLNTYPKYIAFGVLAYVLTACATPKVADIKTVKEIPTVANESNTTAFTPLNLKTYFNDPDLIKLFDQVVEANPDLLIAQERVTMANSYLQRAKMNLLPSLEAGVIASGDHYGKYTIDGVGNYDTNLSTNIAKDQKVNTDVTPNYWLGARSSWEIDAWGKLKNQREAAQKRYFASAEGVNLLKVELFTDIANLYYQLVTLDTRLKIYQENYNLQQRAYEIVVAQRQIGKATELAVQQFNAQNKNILAEIEHLKAQIVAVEQAIQTLTGSYGGEITRGTELMKSNKEVLNQNIDIQNIIHSRPDVAANYFVLEATHADAKAARAAFYPKIGIDAQVGLNSFSAETFFRPSSLAGQLLGGLMVPIFNKGQLKHEFNIANTEQEIAFLTYQKSVTSSFNELQSILKQITIFEKVLDLKGQEVNHLERAIVVSNELYITGYANYIELINTQKTKLQAQLDLLTIESENTRNNVLLFKALGGKLN